MADVILEKTFVLQAGELKRMFAERREFESDRYWRGGRIKYMTHAKGYVMARRPRCAPFVITEKEWRQLPILGA